jgi:pimeloyl-ACP methyl ester carboxylesterase
MFRLLPILFPLLISPSANASDLAREARIAEQIEEAILEGEALRLQADGADFLAIHTPATTPETQGGVILLHGMGAHPDWAEVIYPLRVGLPAHGWETLSIQLPIAPGGAPGKAYHALIPAAGPRILAAIEFFKNERQNTNLVLVGHSLGARMGLEFLAAEAAQEIRAFATVGLSVPEATSENPVLDAIGKLQLPVFDLYGSRDLPAVTQSAKLRRKAALEAGLQDFRQEEVAGADHFFRGLDEALVLRLKAWLRRVASGMEVAPGTQLSR